MNDNEALARLISRKAVVGCQILELGAEGGVSTSALANVCKVLKGHLTTIDNWEGRDDIYNAFLYYSKGLDITVIKKNLFECEFGDKTFDVIYFDAMYSYPECLRMLRQYLPYLKRGGLAVGHGGEFWWGKVTKEIQDKLKDYINRVKSAEIVFPLSDGIVKSLSSEYSWRNYQSDKSEEVFVKLHAGLSLSLHEVFNDAYEIISANTLWWKYLT